LNRLQLTAGTIGLVAAALSVTAWQEETPVSASPRDGADLFMRKGCASCHDGPQSTARMGEVGPSLADAEEWAGERLPGINARDYVRESIRNPTAFRSPEARDGAAMPSLNLSEAEIDALVEYLLASET
jgi:mono/diheme cytochrome c family protein